VRRIVRASFPRFRGSCYEVGAAPRPRFARTVTTRFIIDQTGAVETASLVSSTLNDPKVTACVVSVFSSLSFPAPESGKVRVVYPISFDHE